MTLAALQVVLACGRKSSPPPAPDLKVAKAPDPEPSTPKNEPHRLRIQVDHLPQYLNPLVTHGRWCHRITMGVIFDPLVKVNVAGGYRPHLASKFEVLDHGRRIRLTLRSDVQFHDGRPLTSADVKYTLQKVMARNSPSPLIRLELADLRDVRIPSKQKVDLLLHRTNHLLLAVLAEIPILPAHLYSRRGLRAGKLNKAPVGTGPFVVESRETHDTLVLRRNDDYWGTKPRMEQLVFKGIPDPSRALSALRNGEVDMISNLYLGYYPKQVSKASIKRRFRVLRVHPYRMRLMLFNNRRRPFKDRRVRLALVRLADRQRMVRSIRGGMGRVISAPLYPLSNWYNRTIHPYSLNRRAAARLLDAAGWKKIRPRRWRSRLGWPLKLNLLRSRESEESVEAAQIIKQELNNSGISVNVQAGDFGFVRARMKKGRFDLALVGLAPRHEGDLSPWIHSKGAFNYGAYSNPRVDSLLTTMRLARHPEARLTLARRLHRLLLDDPPFVVLYAPIELMMVSRRIKGLANNGRWPTLVGLSLPSKK